MSALALFFCDKAGPPKNFFIFFKKEVDKLEFFLYNKGTKKVREKRKER